MIRRSNDQTGIIYVKFLLKFVVTFLKNQTFKIFQSLLKRKKNLDR